ncbi:AAA family ATPase [Streptomyces sp. NPDC058470]|uniref:AAA family ATPase n=1 Tax=Streptomyces sp. NPDC058470 TaxID=3346515 RepID=UPI00364F1BF5
MGLIHSALLRAVSGNVQATLCRLEPCDAGGAGAHRFLGGPPSQTPPGTGKSTTAAALAGELKLPLFTIRLDGLISAGS